MATSKVGEGFDKLLRRRTKTGICETCGSPMETHPSCAACGILMGYWHLVPYSVKYQGHDLCYECCQLWANLDNAVGRPTTFSEFAEKFSPEYQRLRWGLEGNK